MTMTRSETASGRLSGTRFGYRFNIVGAIGLTIILAWALVAIFAPLIIPYPVGEIVDLDYFGPMSRELWLGSDYLGRDMLSRILMGARYTVGISLAAVTIACFSGVVLGMIPSLAFTTAMLVVLAGGAYIAWRDTFDGAPSTPPPFGGIEA